jgi:CRP-like cAMP-binding protein
MVLAAMIRSLSIFASLPDKETELLSHYFVEQRFPSGATLPLSLDGESVCLVVVISGSLEWCDESTTGVVNLWPGATFGDLSSEYRFDATVSVVARGTALVAILTRRVCAALIAAHPSAVVSLLSTFAQVLHRQQRGPQQRGHAETRRVPSDGFVTALLRRFFR